MHKLNFVYNFINLSTPAQLAWFNGVEPNDINGYKAVNCLGREPGYDTIHIKLYKGVSQGNIKIYSLNNIDALKEEKYIYPIDIINDSEFWNYYLQNNLYVPDIIKNDVLKGKAKILFFVPYEGSGLSQTRIDCLKKYSKMYNNNIVYADCNMLIEEKLKKEKEKSMEENI